MIQVRYIRIKLREDEPIVLEEFNDLEPLRRSLRKMMDNVESIDFQYREIPDNSDQQDDRAV